MTKIINLLMFWFLLGISTTVLAQEPSPVGIWKTIDDITGKPKAIIQISELKDKTLVGRVLKTFPQPGHSPKEFCTACEGKKRNQRILGMTVMENLKPNKDKRYEWNGGEILDPSTGKVYQCNLRVAADGQKLNVRGFGPGFVCVL